MYEPDFWTQSAEALELSIEGNRLIAQEVGEIVRALWRRLEQGMVSMLTAEHRHLPPV